jgi:hypothetical protein
LTHSPTQELAYRSGQLEHRVGEIGAVLAALRHVQYAGGGELGFLQGRLDLSQV